jgi:hypothetical protein
MEAVEVDMTDQTLHCTKRRIIPLNDTAENIKALKHLSACLGVLDYNGLHEIELKAGYPGEARP